jgi:hypothetical protein
MKDHFADPVPRANLVHNLTANESAGVVAYVIHRLAGNDIRRPALGKCRNGGAGGNRGANQFQKSTS